MNGPAIDSLQDVLLFIVPAIGFLLLSLFHLDELVISPRHGSGNPRAMCGVDADGEPFLSDPDGRPVPPRSDGRHRLPKAPPTRAIVLYRRPK